ncbi:hypothetical protein ASPZODRAFT_12744 [Penicilliopsis zonata CBS 506.65]|uniref:VPS37 C-terminal domain-containing protein n=1 Tax=Penicilliopsis zonata CBS 506.65 TaxID=1073090 RepID=A0A1L9SQX8_9EURO|nr:hypothetical protein ASPZODRAFT_12744 [Penicilliopsis zonata CBS 506.65]OJJ49620.1 hypothetical protein ASPZODRAFT_12744 [Penicilliopsis zonata CBS 506.65]
MSQSSTPYPTPSAFYTPTPRATHSPLNPDTPPPPPPKPSSHEASRRGTPQASISFPPGSQQQPREGFPGPAAGPGANPASIPAVLPEPPSIEEGWLPEIIKDKSTVDLQSILEQPELISALSSLHPSYAVHQQNLRSCLAYNQDLVEKLTELQSHLAEMRTSTETLLLTNQSLEVTWRKKQTEMDTALAPWSPKGLYQRLGLSIAEQEAVCRAVEESFLEGDHLGRASEKEVTDWVRRVRAEAAKLAARKEAKARWDEGRVGGWR